MRSAKAVLDDHLARRSAGDLEGDLASNYAEDVLVLTKHGTYHGKDGIRHTAWTLRENLPDARFSYDLLRVEDGIGLLGWSAVASDGRRTCYGADSFVIRDAKIVAQTIHYEVEGGG